MNKGKYINAVIITWLIAGTLDGAAACIHYYSNTGKNPAFVFRGIASAVFKESVNEGNLYGWAVIGLVFHYMIAAIWTLLFFLFYKQIGALLFNKYVAGIIYALLVWCVMNFLVVPLAYGLDIGNHAEALFSAAKLKNTLIGMGILIIAIGLPISLLADRYYSKKT